MPRRATLGLFGPALLAACASAPPAPPPAPPASLPPYIALLPAPPAAPPLAVIPRAEASSRRAPDAARANEVTPEPLRSEGKRHALTRTEEGVVVLSEERGVLGFLKSPTTGAPIRWAGFVDDDAVLVVAGDQLSRAASPDEAIAGKFEPLGSVDPTATQMAAGGQVFVAAVPSEGGAIYVSRDSGKHLSASKRPEAGPLADLEVRSDGAVVAAIEKERFVGEYGAKGVRGQVWVQRGAGPWVKGPMAEALYGTLLDHRGDTIVLDMPKTPGDETAYRHRGLDAGGRWIETDYDYIGWLTFSWTSATFRPQIPEARPGFPAPRKKKDDGLGGLVGGIVGSGLGGPPDCGVSCLGYRAPTGRPPTIRAFEDGECAREHVVSRIEKVSVAGNAKESAHQEDFTIRECDDAQPARRGTTLLVPDGDQKRLVRLPPSCASGFITGTERASFVVCSGKHQGRPAIHHVTPSGALTEVVSGAPSELSNLGAESASDGTTVLFLGDGAWLCHTAGSPACALIPQAGFLAARPVPFGRALVARQGTSPGELWLELLGEPSAAPLRVMVPGNLLEIETTAEGYIRLWTSSKLTRLSAARSPDRRAGTPVLDAWLLRADGQLVADTTGNEAPIAQ